MLWQRPPGIAEAALEAALLTLGEAGPGQVMLHDLDWQKPGRTPELIARLADRVPGLTAVQIETVPAEPKHKRRPQRHRRPAPPLRRLGRRAELDGLARSLDAFIPSGILPVYVRIFDDPRCRPPGPAGGGGAAGRTRACARGLRRVRSAERVGMRADQNQESIMGVLDRLRLDGKRLFITGGSRGLGREMALAIADAGATWC